MSKNEEFIDINYILRNSYALNKFKQNNHTSKIIASGLDTLCVYDNNISSINYKQLADLCYWLKLGLMWIEFEVYYKTTEDEYEINPINHIKLLLRIFNFVQTSQVLDEIPDSINIEHAECYLVTNYVYNKIIKTLQFNKIPYQINTYKSFDYDYLSMYDDIQEDLEDD